MIARGLVLGLSVGAGALYLMMRTSSAGASELSGEIDDLLLGDGGASSSDDGGGAAPDYEAGAVSAMSDDNVAAFLWMIRVAEGTDGPEGYRTSYGGSLFESFADHPRKVHTATFRNGKTVSSTAAGAYQFLARTWDGVARKLALPDFSPASQDAAAIELIRGRGALGDVRAGRFTDAVRKCSGEWASLPGAPFGQPTITMERAVALFEASGGTAIT